MTLNVGGQGAGLYIGPAAAGGGGVPSAPANSVQFNNAGAFGGSALLTFDGANLTATTSIFADGGVDRSAAARLDLGVSNANQVTIGRGGFLTSIQGALSSGTATPGIVDLAVPDNLAVAFSLREAANDYIRAITTNGAEAVVIGESFSAVDPDFTVFGSGDVLLGQNAPNNRLTTCGIHTEGVLASMLFTTTGLEVFRVNNAGDRLLVLGNDLFRTDVAIRDGHASAFRVQQGTNPYFICDTLGRNILLGNAITNPPTSLLGTGPLILLGAAGAGNYLEILERPADPVAVLQRGQLYTKDVAAVTELFYQRSDGTVVQLS